MAKNAVVSWDLPASRESGNPLPQSDIAHVAVSLSADQGANFGFLENVSPPDVDHLIPDLEDGDWIVRLTVVDIEGVAGVEVDTSFVIDTSAPGPVTNVNVALS